MKTGALYCVQSDYRFLKYSIESVYPVLDKIFFLISDTAWNGTGTKVDNTKTLEVIRNFPDPENKISVFIDRWGPPEIAQRNAGLKLLREAGMDYALVIDADEIYETKELKNLLAYTVLSRNTPVWKCWWHTYWKLPEETGSYYKVEPMEQYNPEVLVKLVDGVQFSNIRDVQYNGNSNCSLVVPQQICVLHHFSYCRTDEELLNKIATSSHKNQFLPNWYEEVWKKWTPEMTNIHPCWPAAYQKAVKVSDDKLPSVMRSSKK